MTPEGTQKHRKILARAREWMAHYNNPYEWQQSDCISSFASVGMCGLKRKCRQTKEHNQTPQTFTEARLYLSKKREPASDNMGLQNECLLQNVSLSSLGFYILYLQERWDWNDQVHMYKATATIEGTDNLQLEENTFSCCIWPFKRAGASMRNL